MRDEQIARGSSALGGEEDGENKGESRLNGKDCDFTAKLSSREIERKKSKCNFIMVNGKKK